MTFSGSTNWTSFGSGLRLGSCTAAGVAGSITGVTWTPKSDQASAGPGGGWNGGNTLGHQNFFQASSMMVLVGVAGNVLTVTTTGLVNLTSDSVNGTTVSGGVTSAKVIAEIGGATGGVGQYTVNGSPQNTGSIVTISANYPNLFDGGWSAATTLTCTGLASAPGSYMFLDFVLLDAAAGPTPAGYSSAVQITNNMIKRGAPAMGWEDGTSVETQG